MYWASQSEPTLRAEVVYALRKAILEQKPGIRARSTMLDAKSAHWVIFCDKMLKVLPQRLWWRSLKKKSIFKFDAETHMRESHSANRIRSRFFNLFLSLSVSFCLFLSLSVSFCLDQWRSSDDPLTTKVFDSDFVNNVHDCQNFIYGLKFNYQKTWILVYFWI